MSFPSSLDTPAALRADLAARGLCSAHATLTPLAGGVSSEIYRVDDTDRGACFVVKRALAKLKVQADWYADVSRNDAERDFLEYLAGVRPDAVPRLVGDGSGDGYFCMEFLGALEPWKKQLLDGRCDPRLATLAGGLLGELHARSSGDPEARRRFDHTDNFDQLRVDPYLRATAAVHPDLREAMLAEADAVLARRRCLIHGDFSPKNLLVGGDRLVMIDCEVAWFGDPAFDLAFLLNHLFLKSLHHHPAHPGFDRLVDAARHSYREAVGEHAGAVDTDAARLLPMLMLARIDGKSPVEYLTDARKQNFIRRFAAEGIRCDETPTLAAVETYRAKTFEHFNHILPTTRLQWKAFNIQGPKWPNRALELAYADGLTATGVSVVWQRDRWPTPDEFLSGENPDPQAFYDALVRDRLSDQGIMALYSDDGSHPTISDWKVLNEPLHETYYADTFKGKVSTDGNVLQSEEDSLTDIGDELGRTDTVWEVLDRFHNETGLPIAITEYDFETTDEDLKADYLRDFLTAAFAHPAVESFTMWGFWEGRHWRPDAAMFNQDWSETPSVQVWRDLVLEEWMTDQTLLTDAGGRLAVMNDAPGDDSTSHMKRDIGLAWLDLPLRV